MKFKNHKLRVGDKLFYHQHYGLVVDFQDGFILVELTSPHAYRVGWFGQEGEVYGVSGLKPKALYVWLAEHHVTACEPSICSCIECKTSNEWAEPNRPDGSFLCYSCKKDYAWKYPQPEVAA